MFTVDEDAIYFFQGEFPNYSISIYSIKTKELKVYPTENARPTFIGVINGLIFVFRDLIDSRQLIGFSQDEEKKTLNQEVVSNFPHYWVTHQCFLLNQCIFDITYSEEKDNVGELRNLKGQLIFEQKFSFPTVDAGIIAWNDEFCWVYQNAFFMAKLA